MQHFPGKHLAVAGLFLITIVSTIYIMGNTTPVGLIDSATLSKSGVSNLSVEHVNGKIYLNVELDNPTSCADLIKFLGIEPITIKTVIYQPVCSKLSNNSLRITYSKSMPV